MTQPNPLPSDSQPKEQKPQSMGVYRSMQSQLKALPYQADKCSEEAYHVVS